MGIDIGDMIFGDMIWDTSWAYKSPSNILTFMGILGIPSGKRLHNELENHHV